MKRQDFVPDPRPHDDVEHTAGNVVAHRNAVVDVGERVE